MIGRLLGWCVRRRGVVAVLTVLALALGCWAALRVALDVFPEFVPAQVDIQTEAPGRPVASTPGTPRLSPPD